MRSARFPFVLAALALVACKSSSTDSNSSSSSTGGSSSSGGSSSGASGTPSPTATVTPEPEPTFDNGGRICTGVTPSTAPDDGETIAVPAGITVAAGFTIEAIARVPTARHIAALPNGDLLVGTLGAPVYLVPHADSAKAGTPSVYVSIDDAPVHGVTFHQPSCNVFVGSQTGVYRFPYQDKDAQGQLADPIAKVRPNAKGGHTTTSVAVAGAYLYASVGSSCNACEETDPTRATIQRMNIDGTGMTTYARRIRNPIALTVNPATRVLWAGVAGQDSLPLGHPYEFFDAVTTHPPVADYGWPDCEENNKAYTEGADCSKTVAPRVVLPAYSTLAGAVFYPANPTGANAFPAQYRGGAFVVARGAWHQTDGVFVSPPRVVYVPMNGDNPQKPVDWADPTKQWTEIVRGFETPDRKTRIGRPTGIAVARDGSLFLSDDDNGLVYRIRPAK